MTIPHVGERFRHFEILARAGEGGMGVVLRARDTRLERDVALKFLTGVGEVDPVEAGRLRGEARALAALNHPNIVTLYDFDEQDGAPYLVLEWVEGVDLGRARIVRPWGVQEFARVALAVAEGLAAAHARGVVHGDLKPANILLGDDGAVKLADFGLAKLRDAHRTRTAGLAGTPSYIAPEQIAGGEVGPQADVYAFGVVAYELLAGRLPLVADGLPAALYATVHTPHVPLSTVRPGLPPALAAVVDRCLAKHADERPADGAALGRALREALGMSVPSWTHPGRAVTAARPEVRYCRTTDGASIAYAAHGAGPVLVRVLGWFTHLEMEWEWPALRRIWERLAERHTVVRYDGRGIGLSGPCDHEFTDGTRLLDLEAVIEAVGAERVTLYGVSEGGWTAAEYAHRHPERVAHLVLYGAYARGSALRPGYDREADEAILTLMRKGWGLDTPRFRQLFTSAYFGPDADPGLVAHFNRLQRAAADGDTAARYQESLNRRGDARPWLATLRTPTVVLHCRDDQIIPFEEGRVLAATIPGARFVSLPTGTHYFPVDDDVTRRIAEQVEALGAQETE